MTEQPGNVTSAQVDPNSIQDPNNPQPNPQDAIPSGSQRLADASDEEKSFEERLAGGTGGGDWHLTDADREADAKAREQAAAEAAPQPAPAPGPQPVQQGGMEPQAVSQPGPTVAEPAPQPAPAQPVQQDTGP